MLRQRALLVTPDLVPAMEMSSRIPRQIHQTYHAAQLPAALAQNAERIRALNPTWAYNLYDDEAIVTFIRKEYSSRVLRLFLRIDPRYGAARADLFRYLLVYKVGGVYLDIKSGLERPLDDVIREDDKYLLSHWPQDPSEPQSGWGRFKGFPDLAHMPRGEFQQWHVAAAAGHPFLRAVIIRVLKSIASYHAPKVGTGWVGVLRTTGPVAYTLAIAPLLPTYPHRFVEARRDLGFLYTTTGSDRGHRAHFRSHYSSLAVPVMTPTWLDVFASRVARTLKKGS
ncbi:MAG: glycosyltransferase [Steroidobacteraceae bacterium]|jgi:hypothetical protein|nr:glycosyltransferase [Steroidobacteraceae bacterium]